MNKTILIIDDDPGFLAQLSDVVTSAGYNALQANGGQEGISLIDQLRTGIDLLIVDLVLPGSSGYEIIGAASRRPTLMKIIATTAVLKDPYLEVATHMGADAVIRKPSPDKPFPAEEWLATIRSVLGAEKAFGGGTSS